MLKFALYCTIQIHFENKNLPASAHCHPCLSVANGCLDSFTSPKTCGANGSNGNPAQCRCTAIARAQERCGLISPARKPVMNWAMRKLELLLAQLPWTKSWFQRRKLPALIGIRLSSKILWYDRVTMGVKKWRSSDEQARFMVDKHQHIFEMFWGLKCGLNNFWRPCISFCKVLTDKTSLNTRSCTYHLVDWLFSSLNSWGESTLKICLPLMILVMLLVEPLGPLAQPRQLVDRIEVGKFETATAGSSS